MDGVKFLALLTLLSNIFLGIFIVLFISKYLVKSKLWSRVWSILTKNSLKLSFVVALTATLGSLYFSEVRGFTPCILCWYQRIFMYPLSIILGVALWKKTKDVWLYVLPLSLIGALIAAYHYYLQVTPTAIAPCSTTGFSVSCNERFFTYFGYITIPWMSLSAFVLVTLLMFLQKAAVKK